MTTYLAISTIIFAALACRSALRLGRRPCQCHSQADVDDLVALVLWTAMMTWGVILL